MLSAKEILRKQKLFSPNDRTIVSMFKALSDVNRYRIFLVLTEQPEISVSDLARILDISLPLTSQHLKILAANRLLEKKRQGKNVYPKLDTGNPLIATISKTTRKRFNT